LSKKISVKNSSPRAFPWLSAKNFFLKNHFFTSKLFSILNMHLYKLYVQIWHNFISVCYI
jgi:hypothetical protein